MLEPRLVSENAVQTSDRLVPLEAAEGKRLVKVVEIFEHLLGMAFTARSEAILRHLNAWGWKTLVVTPIDRNQAQIIEEGRLRLRTYETLRQQLGSPLAVLFSPASVVAYLRTFREFHPDVALIASISPFLLCETLIATKLLGLPIVFDVRDSWIILQTVHPGRLRNWARKKMEGFALRQGDLVVGVTERQIRKMRRTYRLSDSKSMAVYVGCSDRVATTPPDTPCLDLIHAGPPRVYYNTQALLDGVRDLAARRKRLRVAFLGVNAEERGALLADLRKRDLVDAVDVRPPVPRDQVFDVLRTARIGIVSLSDHPTYTAAISTKSLDYIAAGLPILYLGPADSEQGDFIRKFGIGQVAETPAVFAELADRLLGDPPTLREMSLRSLTAAKLMRSTVLLEPLRERLTKLSESKADKNQRDGRPR
jgi:glycosyl transferase family 4